MFFGPTSSRKMANVFSGLGGCKMKTLLVVGFSGEDRLILRKVLSPRGWEISEVQGCVHVFEQMRNRRYHAVLSECYLIDGDWEDVLADLMLFATAPPLIVASRHANHRLWAEILSSGVYDLLAIPFDESELVRVMMLIAEMHARQDVMPHEPASLVSIASSYGSLD
jgi:DNA-binding NtrC family response regulator